MRINFEARNYCICIEYLYAASSSKKTYTGDEIKQGARTSVIVPEMILILRSREVETRLNVERSQREREQIRKRAIGNAVISFCSESTEETTTTVCSYKSFHKS
jgi:hypothetical protein